MQRHNFGRQRGAALLILIMLLGLSMSGLLMHTFAATDQAPRERATLLTMAQAREALLGYAARTGRLPRPAASAVDGRESARACQSADDCTGFLPWVTLGVNGTDHWGNLLRYSVSPAFTNDHVNTVEAVADKTVLTRRAGNLVYRAGQAACTVDDPCAPVILVSSGFRNLGVSARGIPRANTGRTNVDELQNNLASNNFVTRASTGAADAAGGEFDDLITWIPLRQLYQRMNAAGVLR